jgi:ElaB/YqjD/DUF883 family membrane-anchored ribosome-binding protein
MAKPLTKPTHEPEIIVNTPLGPTVTPPALATPVDPVHELPPAQGIHAIPSRRPREREPEIAGITDKVRKKASTTYEKLVARSNDVVVNVRENVASQLRRALRRADFILDEYPLRVIGVVAGAVFVAGVILRFWRSSHE